MRRMLFVLGWLVSLSTYGQAPQFEWAIQMGGTLEDYGTSIATDTSGNVYVTGVFRGTADFDPSPEVYNLSGMDDNRTAFVAKYDRNGEFLWAFALSSDAFNHGYGITTDLPGNVYVTGSFGGIVDFDPGPDVYNLSSMQSGDPFGSRDIFTLKLDSNGSLIWAVNMGASDGGSGESITVDDFGNVYTTGYFRDTVDFDPGPDTFYLAANGFGDADIFISKLNSDGHFVWAKSMKGGSGFDRSISIALDNDNNVYTTGYFKSNYVDFDSGPDTFLLTSSGDTDMFISKLSSNGDFIWAKSTGKFSAEISGNGIEVDGIGNVYTTGYFKGSLIDFNPGSDTFLLSSEDEYSTFISKLDNNGNFIWTKSFSSTGENVGTDIKSDENNNIYAVGNFEDTIDFDIGSSNSSLTSIGGFDAYVLKLNTDGSFIWAGSLSGNDNDIATSLALDDRNNIYTTGGFLNTIDFDPGDGVNEAFSYGGLDIYIHKMKQNCLTSFSINSPTTSFSICPRDSITLSVETSSSLEGVSYSWNTADTSGIIVVAPDTSSIYTVQATYVEGSNICTASATQETIVFAPVSISISDTLTVCAQEESFIEVSGGISYLWSTGDTSSIITITISENHQYIVTVTDENGCSGFDSVAVIVNPLSDTTYLEFSTCDSSAVGTVAYSLMDQNGCDSIVMETTNLASPPESPVPPVDIVIIENEPPFQVMISEVLYATEYEWTVPSGVLILSGQGTNTITIDWGDSTESGIICVTAINDCGSSVAACMTVTMDIPDGLSHLDKIKFNAFPNPVDEVLHVVFSDDTAYEITLLDVLGKEVLPASQYRSSANIDVSRLPAGLYWLKLSEQTVIPFGAQGSRDNRNKQEKRFSWGRLVIE